MSLHEGHSRHVLDPVHDDGPLDDEALDEFYGLGLIDCPRCKGSGEIQFNLSRNRDPQCDDYAICNVCNGDGAINENEARAASTAGPHGHKE